MKLSMPLSADVQVRVVFDRDRPDEQITAAVQRSGSPTPRSLRKLCRGLFEPDTVQFMGILFLKEQFAQTHSLFVDFHNLCAQTRVVDMHDL